MRHTAETKAKLSEARERYCKTRAFKSFVKRRYAMEQFPFWKGGKTHDGKYVLVRSAGHPRAKFNGKYVAEHVLVMEKHIGRYLFPNEVVHHINENKKDNRIENLQLMTRSEHMKTHKPKMRGKIAVCSECGKTKPIDAIKFNCCRYCYLNNHLGYRKSYCNIHKKNHSCRKNKTIFTQNTSSLNVFAETSDFK